MRSVAKIRRTKTAAYGTADQWEAISAFIKERDGYRCVKCGRGHPQVRKLEVNHIIPIARGGRTVALNLHTLCDECHDKMPFHGHLIKARRNGYRR